MDVSTSNTTGKGLRPRVTLADFFATKGAEGKHSDPEDFTDMPDDVGARCMECQHGQDL